MIDPVFSKIYCSNCGQLIPEKSNYCRYCGAAQHGSQASVYHAEGQPIVHDATTYIQRNPHKQDKKKEKYIQRRKLCKDVKWSFFLSYIGSTIILPLLFIAGAVIYPIVFIAALLVYFLFLYMVATAVYDSFYFTLDETGFQKEYGIINKVSVSIPYQQIQNVNITRSLADRMLGLSRLNIETAGSSTSKAREIAGGSKSRAEGHLPGLRLSEAKKVHDCLLDHANEYKSNIA
jgi:membrane protein YdbS with pleckstrin-like domain